MTELYYFKYQKEDDVLVHWHRPEAGKLEVSVYSHFMKLGFSKEAVTYTKRIAETNDGLNNLDGLYREIFLERVGIGENQNLAFLPCWRATKAQEYGLQSIDDPLKYTQKNLKMIKGCSQDSMSWEDFEGSWPISLIDSKSGQTSSFKLLFGAGYEPTSTEELFLDRRRLRRVGKMAYLSWGSIFSMKSNQTDQSLPICIEGASVFNFSFNFWQVEHLTILGDDYVLIVPDTYQYLLLGQLDHENSLTLVRAALRFEEKVKKILRVKVNSDTDKSNFHLELALMTPKNRLFHSKAVIPRKVLKTKSKAKIEILDLKSTFLQQKARSSISRHQFYHYFSDTDLILQLTLPRTSEASRVGVKFKTINPSNNYQKQGPIQYIDKSLLYNRTFEHKGRSWKLRTGQFEEDFNLFKAVINPNVPNRLYLSMNVDPLTYQLSMPSERMAFVTYIDVDFDQKTKSYRLRVGEEFQDDIFSRGVFVHVFEGTNFKLDFGIFWDEENLVIHCRGSGFYDLNRVQAPEYDTEYRYNRQIFMDRDLEAVVKAETEHRRLCLVPRVESWGSVLRMANLL